MGLFGSKVDKVYLVGSQEHHFILDRVYLDRAEAIAYCDNRANDTYDWVVFEAPFGLDWLHWENIHATPMVKHARK